MQAFFLYLEEIDEKLVLFKNNMKSRVVTLRVICYTNCLSIIINRSYSLFYHIYIRSRFHQYAHDDTESVLSCVWTQPFLNLI